MYIKLSSHSLACFWERLRESSLNPLVSGVLLRLWKGLSPLNSVSLFYYLFIILRLCEEVSERPSLKKNQHNTTNREGLCFTQAYFLESLLGVFVLAGLLSTHTQKVFLVLTISVSCELVNVNCLIYYGICHGVWTEQSNRVVTGKCVLVGTFMCSLYIETRFDNVYVAHGLNGDVGMKEADCLAKRRVETCHVCITDINVLCTWYF